MKQAFIDLLKLKTIVTLILIITVCGLTISGRFGAEVFAGLVSSVVTYYFTKA